MSISFPSRPGLQIELLNENRRRDKKKTSVFRK